MGGYVSIAARRMRSGNNNISIIINPKLIVRHWLSRSGSKTMGFVV